MNVYLSYKMGLLSWFSNNKVQTEVEEINIKGQNISVNTNHSQWLEEIKIGMEIVVILIIIIVLAVIVKKRLYMEQK